MQANFEKPKGWWLGLPYIHGEYTAVAKILKPGEKPRPGRSAVFCPEVLFQAPYWLESLNGCFDALADKGNLVVWVPDARYMEPADGAARMTLESLLAVFADKPCKILEYDLIDSHVFLVVQKNLSLQEPDFSPWRKKEKHALVMRTGAHGDAIMASSIFPALKEQGYAITVMTGKAGMEVLKHDPNVDSLLFLESDYQENEAEFWDAWVPRFDKFINLTHSVEGELLKRRGSQDYYWADEQRRAICNESYLAYTHRMANVPGPYRMKFHPSAEEAAWAEAMAKKLGPFILWSLKGSSVHKWWPHAPQAICRLLDKTPHSIVLTGGEDAKDLEKEILDAVMAAHGDISRIRSMTAADSIRHPMALAAHAELVIGPETGILSAAAFESVPKLVFLSHSTARNLTDDWVDATALTPRTSCYPCHRLHNGFDFCSQDEKNLAAACASSITVPQFLEAALKILEKPIPFAAVMQNNLRSETLKVAAE